TGAARSMAEAACEGARAEADTRRIAADAAQPGDLLAAQGYIFACPENLASMSGAMKEFFDRCYYPLLGRIEGRAYATLIAAGARPSLSDVRRAGEATSAFAVTYDPGEGAGPAELLVTGLAFEVLGLAPAGGEPVPEIAHRFGLEPAWPALPVEAVVVRPGPN